MCMLISITHMRVEYLCMHPYSSCTQVVKSSIMLIIAICNLIDTYVTVYVLQVQKA